VGATKEFYAQYKPSAAAPHTPSACEFSSFYGSIGMRPSTLRIEPKRIATVCWTPEEIVEGECAADLLPRARTEDGEAVAITAMRAMVAPAHREGGHGIAFEYIVTANDLPPTQARIIGQVRCEVDGETVERHANTLTLYDHLAPGESATGHGFAFSDPPLTAVPDRCTIELRRATAPSASGTLVAAWCIEGDRTEPGACD
jgi:hypothetical protein